MQLDQRDFSVARPPFATSSNRIRTSAFEARPVVSLKLPGAVHDYPTRTFALGGQRLIMV
jgi:hypothetical protein